MLDNVRIRQQCLSPSPPSSISSSLSGSSHSRLSFLSSSSSSTFSDISISSLPSPPPTASSKTHAFFASPFSPPRSPSPPPPSPPPPLPIPSIDVTTPTIQSVLTFDFSNEPTPRPKYVQPQLINFNEPPDSDPKPGTVISSDNQPSPVSPLSPPAPTPKTTLRLIQPLGFGAFSSVWLAEDFSPVPLTLRSRRSLRDLRRQASAKLSSSGPRVQALSLSRAGSLRKLRKRVPGTRPMHNPSLYQTDGTTTPNGELGLQSNLSRAASAPSSLPSKPHSLTISIKEPTGTRTASASPSPPPSARGRLVAVKMTVRGGNIDDVFDGDGEREREKERTRVAFVREVEVLRHISHPNITPLLTHLTTPTHHVLVLPYLPGGDLLALLNTDAAWRRLCESVLARIWADLCKAVGWMHSVGLVHRDIKLENILLTTQVYNTLTLTSPAPTLLDLPPAPLPLVKLTDFGLSRFVDIRTPEERMRDRRARRAAGRYTDEGEVSNDGNDDDDDDDDSEDEGPLLSTRCGSEAYAAPELVMGAPSPSVVKKDRKVGMGVYDARDTDSWACGVVLYALVARRLPFGEGVGGGRGGRRAWLMKIARGEYEWPVFGEGEENADLDLDLEGDGELMGRRLVESVGARRIVGKLLVRDPRKRARVGELWGDPWMGGSDREEEGGDDIADVQGEDGDEETEAVFDLYLQGLGSDEDEDEDEDGYEDEMDGHGWLVDQDGIDDIARREVM